MSTRTTLPIERLEALGSAGAPAGAGTPAAAGDALNTALQAWVGDALVQAAIYLASPSLSERLTDWLRQPSDAAFDPLRPALFRYFVRMTSRATPFGLFASTSLGNIGSGAFEIGAREALRRRTWLDLGYVHPLVAQAVAGREARAALNYVPNSTLNRTDDGWRYMEERVDDHRRRRDLVRVTPSVILDRVLTSAREAPSFGALIDVIVGQSPDVPRQSFEEPADLRRFTPGSRWLYAKLYGSTRATERLLASELHPLLVQCRAAGSIDRWHFVRYRDSDDHLRVRFHGAPAALRGEVQPALEQLFQRVAHGGAIWRCQFDTYEREATRYGGPEAIELAESIFDIDSETVVGLLRAAPADASPDWRWLLSARFVDSYYEEFSLDLESRERHAKRTEAALRREFRVDAGFEGQISQRFRRERPLLEALFADRDRFPDHLQWAHDIVDAFNGKLAPLAAQFRSLARQDRLSGTLEDISASLAHMHVNRMMLSNPREHELIIHAFLHRICRGRLARLKKSPPAGAAMASAHAGRRPH